MNRFVAIFATTVLLLSLAAAETSAQTWQKLASFPGRPAANLLVGTDGGVWRSRMDFDGDGMADPSFIAVNPNDPSGNTLHIQSGADANQRWEVPLPSGIIAILIGFFDFDGSNPKEILMAQKLGNRYVNPMVLYNSDVTNGTYEVGVPDGSTILIGGWDLNNDGVYELVVAAANPNLPAGEIQVWGFR
ncbi:hypothetical protein EDS67_21650 [candidate division KSB1 bacterium]|nr:MAG: hypothetical protein EDS67_21650 [candidate division KSB1 bacterium]MBC6950573.1 hypothetical protein [candidate division KSB1 bacterium]MCE7944155.1 hypothetical protein [Chlorobi bacterium CHB1]MDL1876787.1 hypothetical protein [Cytophagia bacterium CHB2]